MWTVVITPHFHCFALWPPVRHRDLPSVPGTACVSPPPVETNTWELNEVLHSVTQTEPQRETCVHRREGSNRSVTQSSQTGRPQITDLLQHWVATGAGTGTNMWAILTHWRWEAILPAQYCRQYCTCCISDAHVTRMFYSKFCFSCRFIFSLLLCNIYYINVSMWEQYDEIIIIEQWQWCIIKNIGWALENCGWREKPDGKYNMRNVTL